MTARTFRTLPSVLLGLTPGSLSALKADLALASLVLEMEAEAQDETDTSKELSRVSTPRKRLARQSDPFASDPLDGMI